MKSKHHLFVAVRTVGLTIAGIVGVFIIGSFLVMGIFGDESGAAWLFAFCFVLLGPLALVLSIVLAIRRFFRDRQLARMQDEERPEQT